MNTTVSDKLATLSKEARAYYDCLTDDFRVVDAPGEEELYEAGLVERTWKLKDLRNLRGGHILMSRRKTR